MSTISKKLLDKSREEGNEEADFLQLGIKQDGGGVKSTGKHKVKLISEKETIGRDYHTKKERDEVEYIFEENGVEKKYRVSTKNKNGGVHYFVRNMAEVEPGDEIILEMKGATSSEGKAINVINFSRPAIDVNEGSNKKVEKQLDKFDEEENDEELEINVDDIPF